VPDRVLLVLATSTGGVGRHVASLAAGLVDAGVEVVVAAPASTARAAVLPGHVGVDIGARPSPVRDLRRCATCAAGPRGRRRARPRAARRRARGAHATAGRRHAAQRRQRAAPPPASSGSSPAAPTSSSRPAPTSLSAPERSAHATSARSPVAAPPLHRSGQDPGLGRPLVLAVGRLHPQKGYDTLLAALPAFRDAVVAVAGDGPLEDELRAARRGCGGSAGATTSATCWPRPTSSCCRRCGRRGRSPRRRRCAPGGPLVATAVGGVPDLVRTARCSCRRATRARWRARPPAARRPDEAARVAPRGRAVAATWPTSRTPSRRCGPSTRSSR
jgi:hypothetical protein